MLVTVRVSKTKICTKSRQARDMKDTRTLLLALTVRNPFTTHTDLINIMNSVHESSVNVKRSEKSDRASWTP